MGHWIYLLFNFQNGKVYRFFFFKINIYFFQISTMSSPIISPMLSTFQLPQVYFPAFKGYLLTILCVLH